MAGGKGKGKKKNTNSSAAPKAEYAYEAPAAPEIVFDADATPESLKVKGNALVQESKHGEALAYFSKAIELGPPGETLHIYYSNRSLCALAVEKHAEAIKDAEKCIELKGDWPKGYSRLGAALFYEGRYQEAAKAYAQGLTMEPTNEALLSGLRSANAALKAPPAPPAPTNGKAKVGEQQTATATAEPAKPKGHVVGIDLGTTYSCVAVCVPGAGRVEIIPNADGGRTTPSWVAINQEDGTRLVGQSAKNQAPMNPMNTVNDAKRLIGRAFKDAGVQTDMQSLSYTVKEGGDGKPSIELSSAAWASARSYLPEQISAMVLEQLKTDAEEFLGGPVDRAVITVPAHFNDAQRQATKDAGTIAGLQVLRIINEPTAAALAYGLDKVEAGGDRNVLIFDLGGGTFDVSVLSMEGGIFEVRSTGGDTRLGGEDFDTNVVKFLLAQFTKAHKDVKLTERGMRRLHAAAERAKRQLSSATTTEVEVDGLAEGHDFKFTLTRAKFESLNQAYFDSCLSTVKTVLKDSSLEKKQIDEVVLVGGSTRIPKVRNMLSEFFGGKELCSSINPDEAVAYGAAVQAGVLGGGLAAAGGALAKAGAELVLMDVVPLSLGIETTGKVMSTIVKRNTAIPCRKSDTFTTEEDWQTEVDITVYEGERASTDACNELGEFTISGLERAKRGVPQVLVTFDIDANGILSVTAVDKTTNVKASITISSTTSRNSKEDVARMVKDAEKYAEEDAKLQKKAEARRKLEDLLFDILDSEDANDRQKTKAALAEDWIKSSFDSASLEEINAKVAELRL